MKKIDFGYLGTQQEQKERKARSEMIFRWVATTGSFWVLYILYKAITGFNLMIDFTGI
jgi:hypothetical protein